MIMVYSLSRGGAQRATVEMARAWADLGWDITILTLGEPEADFFVPDPRVRHVRVPLPTQSRSTVASLRNNFKRIAAIRGVLRTLKPQAALGMMSASAILLALAGVGLPGRRYGSERTYPPMLPLRPGRELLRQVAYGMLDGVVCQTSAAASWVSKRTWARATPVAPNSISLPLPRQEPILDPESILAPGDRCLLAVGRFSEEKQFDQLISSFARIVPEAPNWKLVIVGDGPDRGAMQSQVVNAGLCDRVLLPGASGNIADWYSRADLFVMTSRFEGFPNALLEAAAHGVAMVSFDCLAGPSDIIEDHQSGLLVPADDFIRLEAALSQLMHDDDLRGAYAARAREVNIRFGRQRVMGLWNRALGLPDPGGVQ
ncbi:MAG: glycosyltransferase family 4 protein [Sphingomonadales bacterium]|nr:glycosyltransferase family 4 protein [Sphingomonadales bacterium]